MQAWKFTPSHLRESLSMTFEHSQEPTPISIGEFGPEALILHAPEVGAAALAHWVRSVVGDRVRQVIPGDRTVTVHCVSRSERSQIVTDLRSQWTPIHAATPPHLDTLVCPVRFDGEDLAMVADHARMSQGELIALLESVVFEVAFCGFAPGFGYLRGVPEILHLPRRSTPRPRVPAGSLAIAAGYAAIYPHASPGGWHLLGTCGLTLWDVTRTPPAQMQPGRRVVVRALDGRP